MNNNNHCHCQSGQPYEQCCEPVLEQRQSNITPEMLMRSRYTAFKLGLVDYLFDTHGKNEMATAQQAVKEKAELANWCDAVCFVGLEIIDSSEVSETELATVEFKAQYIQDKVLYTLHEKSRFDQRNGRLKYIDGDLFHSPAIKPSRNDACPCGSGVKFKRCHGQ